MWQVKLVFDAGECVSSVTRLGAFWKFSATNMLIKVAQIFNDFEGHFEKHQVLSKTFWATYVEVWTTFISASGHAVCQ